MISEDAKYTVNVLDSGNDLQITYLKYIAASFIVESANSKHSLYSFVRDSEGEGVEVLIEADDDFPVNIRYVTSNAKTEFDRALIILEKSQKG